LLRESWCSAETLKVNASSPDKNGLGAKNDPVCSLREQALRLLSEAVAPGATPTGDQALKQLRDGMRRTETEAGYPVEGTGEWSQAGVSPVH
jgi:hypothetical protein